jgi:mono/diheme cytochrome c family protein
MRAPKNPHCGIIALMVLTTAAVWNVPANAQDAGATFKAKCVLCHGADGKGDTVVGKKMGVLAFGSPEVQKESDSDLAQIMTKGKNKMPSFDGKLKPEDIKSLVAYVRQLGKGK